MVKKVVLFLLLTMSLMSKDIYERKCVPCHKELPTSLQQMFMSYLSLYSGEKNVKAVLKYYLQYPSKGMSVMSDLFIDSYGIKNKTDLSKRELNEAVDIYWEKFKVFNKLK
jgi:hypothetical protein